ncbi:hypothetical protein [Mesorhizobium sp. B1-1-8]|uniref:hypothetical protein n=1 Tax=Mesorhizobium sp. B1-1-8 TaxID=2589976 RepID=UPI0011276B14|nr:hypothetical protein [Mesorhizobium sp. B1-1-8]UCI06556.1 hypothetical protein FJ974_22500 [Mesorhizobium sp. B1-1-8]
MIRYFALAFIFFHVATTAALATQVVLFAETEPRAMPALAIPAQIAGPERNDDNVTLSGARGNVRRYPEVLTRCVEVPSTNAPSP